MAGDARRVDAAHLAGTDADGLQVPRIDDGVGLYELGHARRTAGHAFLPAAVRGGSRPSPVPTSAVVTVLHQQAATDTLEVECRARGAVENSAG
jgi:hypothetical protein